MVFIIGIQQNSQGVPDACEVQPLTNVSVFSRAACSKSWGRSSSISFLKIQCFLYLHTMEPKSGTPHFMKVPKRLSVMSQPAFFCWKSCFVMFIWTAIDQNLLGRELFCKKQREMLFVSSWWTKAAFKYFWILYLNVWITINIQADILPKLESGLQTYGL